MASSGFGVDWLEVVVVVCVYRKSHSILPLSDRATLNAEREPSHIMRWGRNRCLARAHYNHVWRDIIPLLYYEARLVELLHTRLFLLLPVWKGRFTGVLQFSFIEDNAVSVPAR